MTTLEEARSSLVSLLRKNKRASKEERTAVLRAVAEALVDVRSLFERPDGSGTPDWNGRSHAYRVFVREAFDAAGVPREEQATLQAAVRYHVSNVLRERLDGDTLAEYGLLPGGSRERSHDRRENQSALLAALTGRDLRGGALLALTSAYNLVSRIAPQDMDDLDERSRAVALASLRDLSARVNVLIERVDAG